MGYSNNITARDVTEDRENSLSESENLFLFLSFLLFWDLYVGNTHYKCTTVFKHTKNKPKEKLLYWSIKKVKQTLTATHHENFNCYTEWKRAYYNKVAKGNYNTIATWTLVSSVFKHNTKKQLWHSNHFDHSSNLILLAEMYWLQGYIDS